MAFGRGVAKGSISLTSHAIAGAFGAAGRITKTVNKGLVQVLEDDRFLERRERRHAATNAASNTGSLRRMGLDVFNGVRSFVRSENKARKPLIYHQLV